MLTVKTRFAPSPTGMLHLGNVRTALFNVLWARHKGGLFLLRIEDTDRTRSRPEYVQALQEDLIWLGLKWQEGPGLGGPHSPYLQSERTGVYEHYFRVLERDGFTYPCFCSEQALEAMRKAQQAAGRPPRYAGTCAYLTPAEIAERLGRGERPAVRFRVPTSGSVGFDDLVRRRQAFVTADIGDFVIRRADGSASFLFSNALDDALMEVSHVLRGEDHLSNTPRQLLLLQALDLPAPQYGHIPLILGQDATPLAKRLGSASLAELRRQGYLPGAILNYLARLGHQYPDNDFHNLQGLAEGFAVERLGRAPARFDPQQLLHWQRQAVMHLESDTLWDWIDVQADIRVPDDRRHAFEEAVRDNVLFPEEAREWARVLFSDEPVAVGEGEQAVLRQAGGSFFGHALEALSQHPGDFAAMVKQIRQETGVQGKALFKPLRIALTGQPEGPELARLIPLMGLERARQRLVRAQQQES